LLPTLFVYTGPPENFEYQTLSRIRNVATSWECTLIDASYNAPNEHGKIYTPILQK
jgi:hypothetical protein